MLRRVFVAGLAAALPAIASAQPRKKIVVGFISWWPPSMEDVYVPCLRKGLAALGYVEPQTLELVTTFVGADPALVHEATRRLVARKVDVIVVTATPAATIVKQETEPSRIPVVMAPVADPLATGLVQSLARPGGNLTGNTKTFVASLERVATQAGVKLVVRTVDSPKQIDDALIADLKRAGAQAVNIQPIFIGQHVEVVAAATRAGLPSTSDFPVFAEAGALFAYGLDDRVRMERAAYFIDRIVKGTRPADLPIEQPTEFALIVNRKAAAAFGLTIPPAVIAQADQVIE